MMLTSCLCCAQQVCREIGPHTIWIMYFMHKKQSTGNQKFILHYQLTDSQNASGSILYPRHVLSVGTSLDD